LIIDGHGNEAHGSDGLDHEGHDNYAFDDVVLVIMEVIITLPWCS
jgi:hypothetical protein